MKALKTRGMEASHLRELSADELASRIAELERERFNLRFRSATQALDDPLRLRVIRRDLARLKTVQREMGQQAGATRTGGK
jgi:large subunit ribosomal protein L29